MTVTSVGTGVRMRRFSGEDRAAVLELVHADLLPGQPAVTPDVLEQTLHAGMGPEAGGCEVLVSADGTVLGVVSYAVHAEDGAGMLRWLHCVEDEQHLADMLITHTLARLGRRTVHAYAEPTVLAPAGLPVRNRPGTRRALEACGFSATDHARYLHHRLDTLSPRLYGIADLVQHPGGGWQLYLRERDGTRIGEARVSAPVDGTVVLEWLTLAPECRHLGHALLGKCLVNLADRGVCHVTTCLDAPDDRPDQEAALHLHEAAGFTVVDQLHTYTRCP
ncbi:GNAT family N-acetyltransferase [Streptomyces sp. NPDC056069]|uniref:GNAT family N-acetyltransferase n=1 Tax=Streptomyces sp. NPDC056069 TaxID=3345702 RepID=UPI0035E196CB